MFLPEVKEALQYQPNTKSLQDVMYTSGSGGNEEILLEDMLEDTQVIRDTESRESHGASIVLPNTAAARIDCVGYACET